MSTIELHEGSMPLQSCIHATEERILERRQRIGTVATELRRDVHDRVASPGVLVASVGFGVLLERRNRRSRWMPATLLMTARFGNSLLTSLSTSRSPGR